MKIDFKKTVRKLFVPAVFLAGIVFGNFLADSSFLEKMDRQLKVWIYPVISPVSLLLKDSGAERKAWQDYYYYSKPIDDRLIEAFGDPLELYEPLGYRYESVGNTEFLAGFLPIDDYPYEKSITSEMDFFTGPMMQVTQENLAAEYSPTDYESIIEKQLGIHNLEFGEITYVVSTLVDENKEFRINFIELTYSNGPIIQFYLAEPLISSNHRTMLALHGCSSSPDNIFALSDHDYTNYLGLEALQRGWTVIAPYILNKCDWLENFNVLGEYTTGATEYGYELEKIHRIKEFYKENYSETIHDVYGISYGAQLALLYSALDESLEKMIYSGAMNFDIYTYGLNRVLNFSEEIDFESSSAIYQYFEPNDLFKEFLSRKNTRLVLEIGAYDAAKKIDNGIIAENIEISEWCMDKINNCRERLFINFFKGYHEANPEPSLDFLMAE